MATAPTRKAAAETAASVQPNSPAKTEPANLSEDWAPFLLLLVLYILQGIPMGLASSIPVLLKEQGMGYGAKAIFSNVTWPYSLKMLWAPVVDALYVPAWGRRKTWVVPIQLLVGWIMLLSGDLLDTLLKPQTTGDVVVLTVIFFAVYLLVATQDIAVDGWALTMLQPKNVGYASVANSVGQVVGSLSSYTLLLALTQDGFVSVGQFMQVCGLVFVLVTVGVALVKSEKPEQADEGAAATSGPAGAPATAEEQKPLIRARSPGLLRRSTGSASSTPSPHSDSEAAEQPPAASLPPTRASFCRPGVAQAVVQTYGDIFRIVQLPAVQSFALLLLTSKVAFSAFESGLDLELLEKGFDRSTLVKVGVAMSVVDVGLSVLLAGIAAGQAPLRLWMTVYVPRVAMLGLCLAMIVALPDAATTAGAGGVSSTWAIAFLVVYGVYKACGTAQFVAQMAFHNRVADPAIGGTYMTLLNTIANLGHMWAVPTTLSLMRFVEVHECVGGEHAGLACGEGAAVPDAACKAGGGQCQERRDGYSYVVGGLIVAALLWFVAMRKRAAALQAAPISAWRA